MAIAGGIRPEAAGTHHNFPTREINILDPQAQRLHQTQTDAIKQTSEQCHRPFQRCEQPCHLVYRKYRWHPDTILWPQNFVHPRQIDIQHLAIKKQ